MAQEIMFSGDELELLNALDRSGCVLTDDGKFYCDMENDALPWGSRLPVRIKGTYASAKTGWNITFAVMPAPRTLLISMILAVMFLSNLISAAGAGTVLFGILIAAMVINFTAQKKGCLKRFEKNLLRGTDYNI